MSEEQIEPGELTERFRAFSESVDPQPTRAVPVPLIIGLALAVAVLVVIGLLWLLLAG
jgi:hypothetical protein